jgi:ferredoxin
MAVQTLKVSIDPSRCVGYGRCAAVAPGLFMIDQDTNKAFFEEDDLLDAKPKAIFEAARACPTQAITIEQFGRRVYPQILAPMASEVARQLAESDTEDTGEN